jgi:hypothetical protein
LVTVAHVAGEISTNGANGVVGEVADDRIVARNAIADSEIGARARMEDVEVLVEVAEAAAELTAAEIVVS